MVGTVPGSSIPMIVAFAGIIDANILHAGVKRTTGNCPIIGKEGPGTADGANVAGRKAGTAVRAAILTGNIRGKKEGP